MVLRFIARFFLNNEQLVNRLAESYPIRRAAQLVLYCFSKSKVLSEQKLLKTGNIEETLKKFKNKLENELKK